MSFIDTDIHLNTPSMQAALVNVEVPDEFRAPEATVESILDLMATINTSFSILSVSAPGPVYGATEAGASLARKCNEELAEIASEHPDQFGFLAVLPDWQDISGTLSEIEFIYKTQAKANGVVVYSRYGERLLGDSMFDQIWDALDAHSALIFIHPAPHPDTPQVINHNLPYPSVDFAQTTLSAFSSLLASGTISRRLKLDIVLSHGGGTFAASAQPVIDSLAVSTDGSSKSQAILDVERIYLDPKVCNAPRQLLALTLYTTEPRVLFGSDYPRTPPTAIQAGIGHYKDFVSKKRSSWIAPHKMRQNTASLLKKHKLPGSNLPRSTSLSWRDDLFGLSDSPKTEQRSKLAKQGRQTRSEADAGRP